MYGIKQDEVMKKVMLMITNNKDITISNTIVVSPLIISILLFLSMSIIKIY